MTLETIINPVGIKISTTGWERNYPDKNPEVEINTFSILTSKMDMAYRGTPLLALTLHLGIGNYSLDDINFQKFKCWASLHRFSENINYEIQK